MATDYGHRLRQARKHAKLTQMKLSQLTKIPQSTISTAEREGQGSGETPVYAKACGVSALWLATGEGSMLDQTTATLTAPMLTVQASGGPAQLSDYALDLAARFDQLTTKDTRFEAMSACVALLEARAAQSRPTVLKQSNGVDVQRPPEKST